MAFKKIHKRADAAPVVPRRRQIGVLSTTTSHATSTTVVQAGPNITPGGSQVTLSTPTSSHSSTTSSSLSSVSSVSSSSSVSTASSSAISSVVSTPRATSAASTTSHTTTRATTTRSSASATSTNSDSDGMGVGSIAGIAAAAIIGIAVLSAFIIWLIRRKKKNHDIDEEPFNRNSFLRNSTVIPDDDTPIPSRTRPAPNMAERQPTYGGSPTFNDTGYNSFGYNTQPSYGAQPGQMYNPGSFGPGGAPATPLPHSPGYAYDQPGFNNGGYTEMTRGGPHDYPPSPRGYDQYPQSPSYVGHESFPTPPNDRAAAGNYPELSPAPASSQGHVVVANNKVHDGRETPVQLGFAPAQPRQPNGHPGQQGRARPETLYDNEDAYGGM